MDDARFEYLNLELDWPGFETINLERSADGQLTLARVPLLVEEIGLGGEATGAPAGPAGIVSADDCLCDVYLSEPGGHRIWRFDVCAGEPAPLACLAGPGPWPGQLDTPRGLAIGHGPGGSLRLYVADSGNHRIQVFDLATQQPLAVWGQPDPYAAPTPGSEPSRLDDPWDLAADRAGNLYVVDHGNARLQKFSPRGEVEPLFGDTLAAQPNRPLEPRRVALTDPPSDERLYVLDGGEGQPLVLVFGLDGVTREPGSWPVADLPGALALAASAEAVYVGGANGTIVKYSLGGQELSRWAADGRPLAALAIGCDGLLAGAGGLPLRRLRPDEGYLQAGHFQVGPFESLARALDWHRWRITADPLAPTGHVQLFTLTSLTNDGLPPLGPDDPFAGGGWVAQPPDELDVAILNGAVREALAAGPPAESAPDDESQLRPIFFWLGGRLRGDGLTSPVLRQMRLDYSRATVIRYLPAVYRDGPRRRLFLDLALGLIESELGRVDDLLADLPALFDPAAAPAEALAWLASWLDFDLIEDWPLADARRYLAAAIALYRRRGTPDGLRRYLELYAGVAARIEEPAAAAALFALDERVALGFNTALAPAHEQGAVLASTATLGQSHLLDVEQIGAPLFEDVANRFCVQVYAAQLDGPRTLERVEQVLEREKPAHTDYHLCVLQPRMRVGFQARVGIDSIVAGPAPDLLLGEPSALGTDTVLADQPRRSRRLGHGARVGMTL